MKKSVVILAFFACVVVATVAPCVGAQSPTEQEGIKLKATLVNVPVSVSDRNGRYLSGLRADGLHALQRSRQTTHRRL
jgi:hypothetical protein